MHSGLKFAELEISASDPHWYTFLNFTDAFAEIVLSVLLTAFRFELTDKPVVWNFSIVEYPTMGERSTKPELLLKSTSL